MKATRCPPLDLVSQDPRSPPCSSQEDSSAPAGLGETGSYYPEAVPELPAMPTAPAAPVSVATAFPDVPAETAATAVADCSLFSDGQGCCRILVVRGPSSKELHRDPVELVCGGKQPRSSTQATDPSQTGFNSRARGIYGVKSEVCLAGWCPYSRAPLAQAMRSALWISRS
ncbi:hypothetical protein HPB51_015706 [Rhipicephalus microplus]|uniref:Uncharacterized protein n=1 Tax=Rhipicephalus microplus TaxID=6941 RepID=A0A9J6D6C6_RHIMP|nr:hypothetical protein HPB51_015706 [Rhipicephalus microplus]